MSLVTTGKAAEITHLSTRALQQAIHTGSLPAFLADLTSHNKHRLASPVWLIYLDDLGEYVQTIRIRRIRQQSIEGFSSFRANNQTSVS